MGFKIAGGTFYPVPLAQAVRGSSAIALQVRPSASQLKYAVAAPGVISFVSAPYTGVEGAVISFTLNRASGASGTVAVDWAVTISEGAPTPASGTVSWNNGEAGTKSVSIVAGLVTANRTGTITLSNPRAVGGGSAPSISGATANITFTNDTTAPSAPAISASAVSTSSIQIALTAPSTDSGSGLATYTLRRATDSAMTANVVVEATGDATIFPRSSTGLSAGTAYYYRVTATDKAGNATNSTVASATTQGGGPVGAFFSPNLESFAVGAQPIGANGFDAHNGVPHAVISTDYAMPGETRCIKLTYDVDEAGDDLIVYGPSLGGKFVPTNSLFTRSYERFEGPWEGHWPLGLKTARYFTTDDLVTSGSSMPGALSGQYVYTSEKLLYAQNDPGPGDGRTLDYVRTGSWAYLHNAELGTTYTSSQIFGNGLPYIRANTGRFYCFERWMVLNSAMDVPDGILQVWIDGVLVMNRTNLKYKESGAAVENPIPNGTEWRGMWFGGNHSNGVEGTPLPQGPVYRYIAKPYLSSTLDR